MGTAHGFLACFLFSCSERTEVCGYGPFRPAQVSQDWKTGKSMTVNGKGSSNEDLLLFFAKTIYSHPTLRTQVIGVIINIMIIINKMICDVLLVTVDLLCSPVTQHSLLSTMYHIVIVCTSVVYVCVRTSVRYDNHPNSCQSARTNMDEVLSERSSRGQRHKLDSSSSFALLFVS